MSPRIDSDARLTPSQRSRRRLLGRAAGVVAGLLIYGTVEQPLSSHAQAVPTGDTGVDTSSEVVSKLKARSVNKYYPFIGNQAGGSICKPGGATEVYDRTFNTHVTEQVDEFISKQLEKHKDASPGVLRALGFCNAAVSTHNALAEAEYQGALNPHQIDKILGSEVLHGLMTIQRAGEVFWRLPNIEESNAYILAKFRKTQQPFVTLTAVPEEGNWYKGVYGLSPYNEQMFTSNFGISRWEPIEALIKAYIPMRLEDAIAARVDPYLILENKDLRFEGLAEKNVNDLVGVLL